MQIRTLQWQEMPANISHQYHRPIFDFKYRYRFQKNYIGRSLVHTL